MIKPILFKCVKDQNMSHWVNQPISILSLFVDPESPMQTQICDPISMPMIEVQLNSTGEISHIFPDEINSDDWPKELQTVIEAMENYSDGDFSNPHQGYMGVYYQYGLKLAKIKL